MQTTFLNRLKNPIQFFLIIIYILISARSFSQNGTILGKVMDASDSKPVEFANVYFNNSLTGTTTDAKGYYKLNNIDAGIYEFIVSFVGYEPYRKTIRLGSGDTLIINVSLVPSQLQLSEVQVKAKVDAQWRRQLRKFEYHFFGPNITSKDCEILNPEYLNFNENPKSDSFTAESKVPLEIINHRLGYKIYFTLRKFLVYKGNLSVYYGDTRFENLTASTSRELVTWEINRYNVYKGSLRNFFKDLCENSLERNNFMAFEVRPSISLTESRYFSDKVGKELMPLDRNNLIFLTENPNIRYIVSSLPIEIIYTGRYSAQSPYPDMPYEVSRIILKKGKLEINKNGFIYDPTSLVVYGNRAGERAADMLPFEYKPPGPSGAVSIANPNDIYFRQLDSLSGEISGKGILQDQEDVLISTDKPYYLAGDEMWYNVRLVDGFNRQPKEGDRIVHIDLISPNDSVVLHQTLACIDGIASGQIEIPDLLPNGCYLLRGYTDWMRNFSDAVYTGKTVMVHSDIKNPETYTEVSEAKDTIYMNFFPEGGNLLNSVNSKIAFHATNREGEGMLLSGNLVDAYGKEIQKISTSTQGIGEVVFKPKSDQKYFAKINLANMRTTHLEYPLPDVKESGFVMSVINNDRNVFTVHVEATTDLKNHGIILIAQAGGKVFYREAFYLDGVEKTIWMYKSLFPEGVLQLNLFDLKGNFIGQRLVYVDHAGDKPVITVKTGKPEYNPREKVAMQIDIENSVHLPVDAQLSVSVTANDLFDWNSYTNPWPETMLKSEFFEGIENPSYYFRDTTFETRNELDNLMLTLTQYRYDWRRIKGMNKFHYQKAQSLQISGTVYINRKVCAECLVKLFPLTNGMNLIDFTSDENGRFSVKVPGQFDSAKYMMQIGNRHGFQIDGRIQLDDYQTYPIGNWYRNCLTQIGNQAIEKYDTVLKTVKLEEEKIRTLMMQEVSITAKPIAKAQESVLDKKPDLYSVPDQVIHVGASGIRYTSMLQILKQNLLGFSTTGSGFVAGGPHSFNATTQNPLFIIDGVEMLDSHDSTGVNVYEELDAINPLDVERVEVYKGASASYWGARGANGVIVIYTKNGSGRNRDNENAEQKRMLKISGFSPEVNFNVLSQDSTVFHPDNRITIFWANNLHTDSSGSVMLNFSNAVNANYFTVHIEGITAGGVPFSYVERTNQ